MFDRDTLMNLIAKNGGTAQPNGAPYSIDQIWSRFQRWFNGLDSDKRNAFLAEVTKADGGTWDIAKKHGFSL